MNSNKNNIKLKPTIKIISCYTLSLILFLASFYLFNVRKIIINSETPKVDYALSGKTNYVVKLKENEYYNEEQLKSGMQYIASLIKSIDINFKYEAHASDKINYKYKYDVTATTIVNSKNDKSKVLFEKKEEIVKPKNHEVNDTNFVIDEVISIDYDKYNDYILNYKKEFLLNTLFDLIVNVHVETTGKSDISEETFTESKDFAVVIPLSEQLIDITLQTPSYQTSGIISGLENITTKAYILYFSGLGLAFMAIILIIFAAIIIAKNSGKKSKYNKVIEKYLKEYDRAIVITHKSKINESDFDQVIGISSIQEMLDLHDNFQLPILYYEIVKNELSYFIIIKENILYKLIISKKLVEENSGDY